MIKIVHDGDQAPDEGLAMLINRIAEVTAEREGMKDRECELSLLFADPDEIRELNMNYRGIDSPTDVLSFPMGNKTKGDVPCVCNTLQTQGTSPFVLQEPTPFFTLLGDVVICREVADKQAKEYGHSIDREIAFLFTHGLLHLLGHDHGEVMREAEEDILEKASISG